jgi:hypothetical protein
MTSEEKSTKAERRELARIRFLIFRKTRILNAGIEYK